MENPQIQPDLEGEKYIVGRILKPEARKDIIEFFDKNKITPTAMMDISDGLSSDVLHICKQSNLGCRIYEEKLPLAEETRQAAFKFGLDPTVCALNGGEDYELLFTIKQSDFEKIKNHADIHFIGYVHPDQKQNVLITKNNNVVPLKAQGWEHFESPFL